MIASPTPNQLERAVTGDWRVASALRYFVLASRWDAPVSGR